MERNKKLIIILVIAIGMVSTGLGSYFVITTLLPSQESLDSKIQELMDKYDIPSLAAGIIVNESLIWVNGFGEQPDLDTVYMIGSITKTFTATVILQLNESGLLNLDDDINKHLPFDVRHPSYPGEPITIRMLLTHTSGIQTNLYWSLEYYFDDQMIDWINENLDLGPDIIAWAHRPTLEEFLNGSLNPAGPYYDSYNWYARPGNQYCYSNAGFQLLGYLIEVVSNQSLMDYVQENIFDPLNMSNSGYNYIDFVEKNAIPYEWKTHPIFSFFGYNFEFPFYNINVTGAGSIRTTVQDIAKFLITQMNQGELNGTHLLNPESVKLMHSIQVSLTGHSTEGFDYEGYGLGWNIFSDGIIGHGGATPGFSSNMVFKKTNEGNFGMIIMFNRGSALIWDEELVNNFIPTINQLIFEHAEKIFQQALST